MPSKFGGIPVEQSPQQDAVKQSRFGGVPVNSIPQATPSMAGDINAPMPGLDRSYNAVERGAGKRMLGVGQLLNNIGVGKHIGIPDNDVLQQGYDELVRQGKNKGAMGFIGEQISDPITLMGGGEMKAAKGLADLAKVGGKYGALSGLTNPAKRPEENVVNSAIGSFTGNVLGPVVSKAAGGIGKGVSAVANKLGLTGTAAEKVAKYGLTPPSNKIYQAAKDVGLPTEGKSAKEIYTSWQNWLKANTKRLGSNITTKDLDPVAANFGISEMYGQAMGQNTKNYDALTKEASKFSVPSNDIENDFHNIIGSLRAKKELSPREARALPQLESIYSTMLAESGNGAKQTLNESLGYTKRPQPTLNASLLVKAKQALNEGFDQGSLKSDPYAGAAHGKIMKTLNAIPEIAGKLKVADDYFINNIANKFRENPVLDKFWQPEDYYAFQNLDRLSDLPAGIKKRAYKMLDNIKDPVDLDVLAGTLPKESGLALKKAKFQQTMEKAGLDADKIEKNYPLLQKSLEHDFEGQAFLDNTHKMIKMLNDRGIKNLNEHELDDVNKGIRQYFSLLTKAGVLRHALDKIAPSPAEAQARILTTQKEILNGAPKPNIPPYVPNPIIQNAVSGITGAEGAGAIPVEKSSKKQ